MSALTAANPGTASTTKMFSEAAECGAVVRRQNTDTGRVLEDLGAHLRRHPHRHRHLCAGQF
jgi:hypothetical protein